MPLPVLSRLSGESGGSFILGLFIYAQDYVATLAQGVNSVSYATLVALPLDLRNDTLYNLRFSAPGLRKDVWTADFTILPESSNLKSGPRPNSLSAASKKTSTLASTQSASQTTTTKQTISEITPATTIFPDSLDGSLSPPRRNGAVYSRADQVDKARFRLLFIVWPAMFGLSMAL